MKMKYDFENSSSKKFPMLIVLENTNVCNLRCIHCPIGQGWTETPHYKPSYMSWNIYKKIIDEISQHTITQLIFSPEGENLVHPEFIDQLIYAKEMGINKTTIITNALTLDNLALIKGKKDKITNIEAILNTSPEVINISLDAATKKTYENIRKGSNYHRVWSNVHRLLDFREKLKSNTKIILNIIEQKENNDEINLFKSYWGGMVDRILVRPYLNNLGLTPNKSSDSIPERWPCPQFWKRISINSHGGIRFCVVDWDDKSILGNIKNNTIQEIWSSAEYDRLRGCHIKEKYDEAHKICGPCTDWKGMRWDWGYEKAIGAIRGDKNIPDIPSPLE